MSLNILLSLDPLICSSYSMHEVYFYLPVFFVISFFSFSYWVSGGVVKSMYMKLSQALVPAWMETTASNLKGFIHLLMSIFIMIFSLNLVSLFPLVFAYSAHLSLSVSLALPLWFSLLFSGWVKNPVIAGGSLVPYGAPLGLTPFLCVLETVSLFIRPVSLSLRLAVNISAGHCFLSFISQLIVAMYFCSSLSMGLMLFIHIGYFVFEVGISFIQAYIFTTLLALYSNDHPH